MSKIKLFSGSWETIQEICDRTEATVDEVTDALKSLHKKNMLLCLWPGTGPHDLKLRFKQRTEGNECQIKNVQNVVPR